MLFNYSNIKKTVHKLAGFNSIFVQQSFEFTVDEIKLTTVGDTFRKIKINLYT